MHKSQRVDVLWKDTNSNKAACALDSFTNFVIFYSTSSRHLPQSDNIHNLMLKPSMDMSCSSGCSSLLFLLSAHQQNPYHHHRHMILAKKCMNLPTRSDYSTARYSKTVT